MNDSQKWLVAAGVAVTGWLIYLLSPVLTPFVAGALLAYLTDPLVDRLETVGFKRIWAVVVVFAAVILAAALAVFFLAPMLEHQFSRLMDSLPAYAAWLKSAVLPWLRATFGIRLKIGNLDQLSALISDYWRQSGGSAASLFSSLSRSGTVVVAWLMNILLIPVVTFYLLRDWDILVRDVRDLIPRRYESTVVRLAGEADEVLGAFLRGQFWVMLALSAIYTIGLWLVDLNLALLIGMVAGLISFVPYMGVIVGVLSGCVAAVVQFGDIWASVPVLAVFGVGQMLEGMVLTPRLVGGRIGLHPVAVIFAVLAGGQLFGFLGVMLALPVASVIMVLIRHIHDRYKGSELYGVPQQIKKDLENAAGD